VKSFKKVLFSTHTYTHTPEREREREKKTSKCYQNSNDLENTSKSSDFLHILSIQR